MAGPTLYIRNALREAEKGIGDGTAYATGTSATVSQANKTIALVGKVLISDIGADADDKFNSHILYFPASKNAYHIVDWVAATSTATVFEVPETTDTGACEIRRGVVDVLALAANPALYLSDGLKGNQWKSSAATNIFVSLPNLIDNGGFESGITGWTKIISGGTTDISGINTTAPILGTNDLLIDQGDRSLVIYAQDTKTTLKVNRKYSIIFKARAAVGFTAGSFLTGFFAGGFNTLVDVTMTNPSSGVVNGFTFEPLLTTTNTWHSVDLTVNQDHGSLRFIIENKGAADVNIDEIYIFETLNVDSFIKFDALGKTDISIRGLRAPEDRTGFLADADDLLMSSAVISPGEDFLKTFTAGSFPIYRIGINSSGGIEVSTEMFLAEKWALPFAEEMPTNPKENKRKQTVFTTRSGRQFKITQFNEKLHSGTFRALSATDVTKYQEGWVLSHFDDDYPFAVVWETGGELELMLNNADTSGLVYNDVLPDWPFDFKQVL